VFCLRSDLPEQPWRFWTLLSYGFLHDGPSLQTPAATYNVWHIVFNMLTLWFFGRPVEAITGGGEFLRFYGAAIVVAGLAWVIGERVAGTDPGGLQWTPRLIGASGGVMAVLAAFIWYYPRQTVLIYGVLPVPAWALGVVYLWSDIAGAGDRASHVAHVAHLAGAGFGLLYAWRGWSLAGPCDAAGRWWAGLGKRRLRLVRPDDEVRRLGDDEPTLEREVDRILEKIARSGESSLTTAERDTLTRASRRLKDRRS